ncbi:hypothetical protein [Streptomyces albireticuli]|nr:hypothetical protein [Streptomyces albireticuli]
MSSVEHLGPADDLVADGLGEVPQWVAYFDATERAGTCGLSRTGPAAGP